MQPAACGRAMGRGGHLQQLCFARSEAVLLDLLATQAALSLQTALCRLQARLDDCLQRNTKQLVLRVQALARGFIVSPCHGQPRGYNAIVPFRVCACITMPPRTIHSAAIRRIVPLTPVDE